MIDASGQNKSGSKGFSAVPCAGHVPTVVELVIKKASTNQQKSLTTIVIVPWLIESTTDLNIILRFHHMAMDAKAELIHAIYHQLLTLIGERGNPVEHVQFIVRIITAEQPLWVIDLLAPLGFSSVHINDHFTGNSAGATTTVEFDGIPMQVIGGYGISSAPLPGFSHPSLCWANLPITQNVPLRYFIAMMDNMRCASEGTLSVLYAKAELIRTKAKRKDRHSLNQKANSLTAPTFIFQSPQFLKYFLDHFSTFMHACLPPFVVGHSGASHRIQLNPWPRLHRYL
jgi:hypothetical protein